jgi:hypothetical protein
VQLQALVYPPLRKEREGTGHPLLLEMQAEFKSLGHPPEAVPRLRIDPIQADKIESQSKQMHPIEV